MSEPFAFKMVSQVFSWGKVGAGLECEAHRHLHRILPLGADAVADAERETAKYLSNAIKEATGRSASDWIDEYVATESKALLYSTTKTIQQIASELHFDSQSLFGKYFKRVTGISPREYRASIAQGNSN